MRQRLLYCPPSIFSQCLLNARGSSSACKEVPEYALDTSWSVVWGLGNQSCMVKFLFREGALQPRSTVFQLSALTTSFLGWKMKGASYSMWVSLVIFKLQMPLCIYKVRGHLNFNGPNQFIANCQCSVCTSDLCRKQNCCLSKSPRNVTYLTKMLMLRGTFTCAPGAGMVLWIE